jgi:hypothetical protein
MSRLRSRAKAKLKPTLCQVEQIRRQNGGTNVAEEYGSADEHVAHFVGVAAFEALVAQHAKHLLQLVREVVARVEDTAADQVQRLNELFAVRLQATLIGHLGRIDFKVMARVDDGLNEVTQRLFEVGLADQLHVGLHGLGGQAVATEYEACVLNIGDFVKDHVAQVFLDYLQLVCDAYKGVGQVVLETHVQMRLEDLDDVQVVLLDVLEEAEDGVRKVVIKAAHAQVQQTFISLS